MSVSAAGSVTEYAVRAFVAPRISTTLPNAATDIPARSGDTAIAAGSNFAASSSLSSSIWMTLVGGQSPPPQSARTIFSGAYVRHDDGCPPGVTMGPSADGVPLPMSTAIDASAGNGSTGRNAIHRPSTSGSVLTTWSAFSSSAVARRTGRPSPSAVSVTCFSTSPGSTR